VPKLCINLEETLSGAYGVFDEQNKVLESSVIIINYSIIINYCIITINAYYN
jgi:hypothetical protein